jgi:hypothetical protein
MVPSWMLRRKQVEDGRVDVTGYVRSCYPTFVVFNVLGYRGIVIIYPFAWSCIYNDRVDEAPCHFPSFISYFLD